MTVSSSTPVPGRLIGFVGSSDLDSARDFYAGVLGLELDEQLPFALVADLAGTMLRITQVDEVVPAPYTVLGWAVDDVDATVDHLAGFGVQFLRYDALTQDSRAIWIAPGGAKVAWFLDPDGNVLSLTQFP